MKIGIITFHRAINYGASLQTYALKKVIENNTSKVDVMQIDFDQPYVTDGSKLLNIRKNSFFRSLLGTVLRFPASFKRNRAFRIFWEQELNFYKLDFDKINSIDCLIVGSDQVWNTDIIGEDDKFFLDFSKLNRKYIGKKISYAASIGKSELNELDKIKFEEKLSDFNSISVREVSLKKELDEINISSKVVLDPTLLLNKNEWVSSVKSDLNIREKFILVYILEKNIYLKDLVEKVSKATGIDRVIEISSSVNLYKINNTYSPGDFISLYNQASFVITNSFHGTAFAVNFNKEFITIPHSTRNSRISDFLSMVSLEKRMVDSSKDLKMLDVRQRIDYTISNEKLEEERKKSLKFLLSSLEE